VEEMTGTIHVGRSTLLTHHTILHPAGDFHVRVLHARDGLEYRGGRSDVDGLCARILRDALVHFGQSPCDPVRASDDEGRHSHDYESPGSRSHFGEAAAAGACLGLARRWNR
jgi:hypothetical protein